MSDFYFGLGENVAFGAQSEDTTKRRKKSHPEALQRYLNMALLRRMDRPIILGIQRKMIPKPRLLVIHRTTLSKLQS